MYKITFWNRSSTNFGQNSFVRRHGTDSFGIEIEANALACMMGAVRNPDIQQATMSGPQGTLTWSKTQPPATPHFDPADECDYEYGDGKENFHYDDHDCDDCLGPF